MRYHTQSAAAVTVIATGTARMKNLIVGILALLVLGGGYYWYAQNAAPAAPENDSMSADFGMTADEGGMDAMDMIPTESVPNTPSGVIMEGGAAVDENPVTAGTKEFTVTGKNFAFAPANMTVKKGDRVRITFVNDAGTHDLKIEGYDVGTSIIKGGATETFEFVADKAGSFEYYCSVGSHRQMGMKGTLIVQ